MRHMPWRKIAMTPKRLMASCMQRGQSSSTEVRLKVAMSAATTPEINNVVYYRSLNVGIASSYRLLVIVFFFGARPILKFESPMVA